MFTCVFREGFHVFTSVTFNFVKGFTCLLVTFNFVKGFI